jgi:PAS domain S-box-containing protein
MSPSTSPVSQAHDFDICRRQIRALLVEDNPADAFLLREAVRESDGALCLEQAETLSEALQKLSETAYDVILLDLSLPDAGGLEKVRQTHARTDAPIVVLTGLDDEALALHAISEGAQDYLVKGQVTGPVLRRAIRYATERKRTIEALERSETYFRSLIENALDLITVIDADGTIQYASPSHERVLGYPPTALQRCCLYEVIHPDDVARVRSAVTQAHLNEKSSLFEFRVRCAGGEYRILEAIGRRFDLSGTQPGIVLNLRDVTERHQAEEELRRVNETLRTLIETSPLAICTLDAQSNVASWNAGAERIFGFSSHQVLGRPFSVIRSEDETEFRRRLRQALSGAPISELEAKANRSDGIQVDLSIWIAPLRDSRRKVTGALLMAADDTQRKNLEAQFQQAQKMEAVGRLAGGVAHDFNNLLTVISGYCQLIYDELPPDSSQAEALRHVLKASDRAAMLTQQLLAFSRRQVVQPKVVNLCDLIQDMRPLIQQAAGDGVELRLLSGPNLGNVLADPGQISQVILNLVVNAHDAMPHGGKLTIELRNVDFDSAATASFDGLEPGTYVLMAVCDTGVGITPETMRRLFEPFFTTKEKGHGLGLSTSYGIVKQSGGHILVYSEPGQGSTFKVFLPRVQGTPERLSAQQAEEPDWGGRETILLVEDEDDVRTVTADMLRRRGYTVLMAATGLEALQMYQTRAPIHLLITDVAMPDMRGLELARRLRRHQPDLKVLFISGYASWAVAAKEGLNDDVPFLQKPFTARQLAAKVRDVLTPKTLATELETRAQR